MKRTAYFFFLGIAGASALTVSACSSGDIAVGSSAQALQKKKDGTPTGNGTTCGWDQPVTSDPNAPSTSPSAGTSRVGDKFKAPDGCNDCTCTDRGITCTEIACVGNACTEEARKCPDGSYVGRTGPACEFQTCPSDRACTEEAKKCPDGSYVSRTGPACEFAACPTPVACDTLAKICPDGTGVGRVPPSCDFAPCP